MNGVTSAEEWKRHNDPVIAAFRANRGRVPRRKWPLLLLIATGANTGRQLVTPLYFGTDGDRVFVIATNGGSRRNPAWYRNLVANPEVTVELGAETFRARASTAEEPTRTRLYDTQAARMRYLDGYRKRVKAREIPVVILERLG
jgi:deazaflavin-dependent oxidoreductase (nitroreductase family)